MDGSRSKRIVHVGPDSAFVQYLVQHFETAAPGQNECLVLADCPPSSLQNPHPVTVKVRTYPTGLASGPVIAHNSRGADILVVHGMSPQGAMAILCSARDTVCVWSGWGADYYGTEHERAAELLDPETLALWNENNSNSNHTLKTARAILFSRITASLDASAARRTDYFSAPIPDDEPIFRSRFPQFKGEYAQLNYGDTQSTFARGASPRGRDILVGNSASYTNNHVEAFQILAARGIEGRKIFVPLSYGDSHYRDLVIAEGTRRFGHHFVPIVKFLPLKQYLDVVSGCSIVIMNHRRQQGIGNIGSALYNGSHLYLHSESPTLSFLKRIGAAVHRVDELTSTELPTSTVDALTLAANRAALDRFWSPAEIARNVRKLIASGRPTHLVER